MLATETDSLTAAVKKLFGLGAVGMKTNCLVGRQNSTPVALTEALGDLLEDCNLDANEIIVWERTSRELERAGYKLNAASTGRRCLGTDSHPHRYGSEFFSYGQVNSLVSALLVEEITSHINVPVLKDHSIAGLSGGLKNMYGAVHNPNKYHDNHCNPYAAHVSALPPIRDKHRLTVIDASRIQYDKGPGFMSNTMAPYGAIIVSTDPVAADSVGLYILEKLRRSHGLPTLEQAGRPAGYLEEAARIGLGQNRLDQITVVREQLLDTGRFSPREDTE